MRSDPDEPASRLLPHVQPVHLDTLADPGGVRFLRTVLSDWLQQNFTFEWATLYDMTLATNEALANAAEHAYPTASVGSVTLRAAYDHTQDEVTVTVTDHGRWHAPTPDPLSLRGRGLPLIRALTHRYSVESAPTGTVVTLIWTNCRSLSPGSPVLPSERTVRSTGPDTLL